MDIIEIMMVKIMKWFRVDKLDVDLAERLIEYK